MDLRQLAASACLALCAALPAQAGVLELMMVEQPGCTYCLAWKAEVGPEYPKTAEGRAAPLLSQDLRSPLPEGVTLVSPPVFTPTFVLLDDGQEVARIEGYAGEDFFWGLLAGMIRDAGGSLTEQAAHLRLPCNAARGIAPWATLALAWRRAGAQEWVKQVRIVPLGEFQPYVTGESAAALAAEGLSSHALDVANFLKALGHDGRLMILCHLLSGPKSVTELETLLSSRQAAVSQQLARLRLEGLVSARREGQAIFYSILDPRVSETVAFLARLWCRDSGK